MTDGPAASPEAAAVRTKRPAPMMAPIPRAMRLLAVRVRLRSLWLACSSSTFSDFLRVRLIRFAGDELSDLQNITSCDGRGENTVLLVVTVTTGTITR